MRAKVLGYAEPVRVRWESLALLSMEGYHREASSIAMVVCYGVGLLLQGFWRSVCPELYGCDVGDALGFLVDYVVACGQRRGFVCRQ